MSRRILSVGFKVPGTDIENIPFDSNQSLLDADLIIFRPAFGGVYESYKTYQGKRLLSEADSFVVTQHAAHWRSELNTALDAGKTIFVYLPEPDEVYIHTGKEGYSGTGKNRLTTSYVELFNSYRALPFNLGSVIPKRGKSIRAVGDAKLVAAYWKEFSQHSNYEVYIDSDVPGTVLATKTGNKAVGAVLRQGKGTLIMLPVLTNPFEKKAEFGKRLVAALVEIDKTLRSGRDATPAPEWTNKSQFRLAGETTLEQRIKELTDQIEALQLSKSDLSLQLEQEGGLRRLLYETGKPLEDSILQALKLMGFDAEPFVDAESEFDAVFTSIEGRFLGEAEGKDNKAVNIDKLSQLERNLQEDFGKEGVTEYAKGVLFGNAFRLTRPEERGEFFTEKCKSGAKRSKVALVKTPDLFTVAKYLREFEDPDYATNCREAIYMTEGEVVVFPQVPSSVETDAEELKEVAEEPGTSSA